MGEKKILTEEMIEEKLSKLPPHTIRYVDPWKMAVWKLDTAVEMADGSVSKKTIERAIELRDLNGFQSGKFTTVVPAEFLIWLKRSRK